MLCFASLFLLIVKPPIIKSGVPVTYLQSVVQSHNFLHSIQLVSPKGEWRTEITWSWGLRLVALFFPKFSELLWLPNWVRNCTCIPLPPYETCNETKILHYKMGL